MSLAARARRLGRALTEAISNVADGDEDEGNGENVANFVSQVQRVTSGNFSPSLHEFYDGLVRAATPAARALQKRWENTLMGHVVNNVPVPGLLGDEVNTILRLSSTFAARPFWFAEKDIFWTGHRDAAGAIHALNTAWENKTIGQLATDPAPAATNSGMWQLFRASWVVSQNFFTVFKVGDQVDPFIQFLAQNTNIALVTDEAKDLNRLYTFNAEARRVSVIEKNAVSLIHLGVWPALDIVDQSMRRREALSGGLLAMLTVIAVGVQLARWAIPKLFAHFKKAKVDEAAEENPTLGRAPLVRSNFWTHLLIGSQAAIPYQKMYTYMQELRESFTQVYDGWDLTAFNPPLKLIKRTETGELTREDFAMSAHSEEWYQTDCPEFLCDFMTTTRPTWLDAKDVTKDRQYPSVKVAYEHLAYALLLECMQAARSRVFVAKFREKLLAVRVKTVNPNVEVAQKKRLLFQKTADSTDLTKMVLDGLIATKSPSLYDEHMTEAKVELDNLVTKITGLIVPRLADYTGEKLKRRWQQAHTDLGQLLTQVITVTTTAAATNRMRYSKGGPTLAIWLRLAVVGELTLHNDVLVKFFNQEYETRLEIISNIKRGWFLGGISDVISSQVNWITKATEILRKSLTTEMFGNGKNFERSMTAFSDMYQMALDSSNKLKALDTTFGSLLQKIRPDPVQPQRGQLGVPIQPQPIYTKALDDSNWIRLNNRASISANLTSNVFYLMATSFFGHMVGTDVFVVYGQSYGHLMQQALGNPNEWNPSKVKMIGVTGAGSSGSFNVVSGVTVSLLTLGLEFVANAMAYLSEWAYQHLLTTKAMTDPWRPKMAMLALGLQLGTLATQGAVAGTLLVGAGKLSAGMLSVPILGLPALATVMTVGAWYYRSDNRDWTLWLPEGLRTAVNIAQLGNIVATLYRGFSVTGNWSVATAKRWWVEWNTDVLSLLMQAAAWVVGKFADKVVKEFVGPALWAAGGITTAALGILAAIYYGSGVAVSWILRRTVTGEPPSKRRRTEDIEQGQAQPPPEARPQKPPPLSPELYNPTDAETIINNSVEWGILVSRVFEPLLLLLANAAVARR